MEKSFSVFQMLNILDYFICAKICEGMMAISTRVRIICEYIFDS